MGFVPSVGKFVGGLCALSGTSDDPGEGVLVIEDRKSSVLSVLKEIHHMSESLQLSEGPDGTEEGTEKQNLLIRSKICENQKH